MKFFAILLIFLGSAMLAPDAFGSELFYGKSSIERFPQVIDSDEPQIIEIKFQYQEGPYSLNIEPLFVVSPKEAIPFVQIEFDETEGIPRMSVKRIIGTITVDQGIPSEKIFLNISYNGTYTVNPPQPFKSSWSNTMIINIEKDLVPEPDDNPNLEKEPFCGEGTTYTEGVCVVEKIDDSAETSEKWGKYQSTAFESPLKQFRSETTFNETQCRYSLILVMKHNGSPACVNFDTIPKLIQRGWIDTDPRAEADKNIPKYLCELYGGGFFDGTGECMDIESSYKCQMSGGKWDGKCMIPNHTGRGIGTEPESTPGDDFDIPEVKLFLEKYPQAEIQSDRINESGFHFKQYAAKDSLPGGSVWLFLVKNLESGEMDNVLSCPPNQHHDVGYAVRGSENVVHYLQNYDCLSDDADEYFNYDLSSYVIDSDT